MEGSRGGLEVRPEGYVKSRVHFPLGLLRLEFHRIYTCEYRGGKTLGLWDVVQEHILKRALCDFAKKGL